jgi:hypothetical protein
VPRAALVGTLVVLLLGVGGSAAGFASRAAIRTQAAPVCPAARVRHEANERLGDLNGGRWIVTSPRSAGIFAYLWGGSEIDGRVAVYAGGVNPNTGTNEKVMWIVDPARRLREGRLRIVAQRLRVTPTVVSGEAADRFVSSSGRPTPSRPRGTSSRRSSRLPAPAAGGSRCAPRASRRA